MLRRTLALAVVVGLAAAGCDRAEDASGPVDGGTLRVATVGDVDLDPAHAVDRRDVAVVGLVYDTLIALDHDSLEPIPGLAREWEASDDQRRFRFTLDERARFHDGRRVRAEDVAASWTRVVDPATASPLAHLLGVVAGYEEAREGDGKLAGVTVDGDALVVELSSPRSDFPATLAHPGLGVKPADRVTQDNDAGMPVGSGPFSVESHEPGLTRLVATDEHSAHVDAIELRAVRDPDAAATSVAADASDLALVEGETPIPANARERRRSFLAVSYYAVNLAHPALADQRFRAAIALAVDPTAVVDAGYGDAAEVAVSVAPTALPGVGEEVCGDRCGPDRERARALLAEVFGASTPHAITISFDDTQVQARVAAEVAAQLAAVGIPVERHPIPPDEYDAFLVNDEPMLFRFGWVSDIPTPRAFLAPVFVPGAGENVTRMDSPAVVAGLDAAATEPNQRRRAGDYGAAQDAILDSYAVIPIAELVTRYAVSPAVEGLEITIFGGFSGSDVWLRPEEG